MRNSISELKEKLMKKQQVRIPVVHQPSLETGVVTCYFQVGGVEYEHPLYYDVKEHPKTKGLKLYVYHTPKDRLYAYRKDRVYETPLQKLDDVKMKILKLHRNKKRLHHWGTPDRAKHVIDELNPFDKMLLDKIERLRDWACRHGYPIHEVLEQEYEYYQKSFKEYPWKTTENTG